MTVTLWAMFIIVWSHLVYGSEPEAPSALGADTCQECVICFELIIASEHQPLTLRCGHRSFHVGCIIRMSRMAENRHMPMRCPLCRSEYPRGVERKVLGIAHRLYDVDELPEAERKDAVSTILVDLQPYLELGFALAFRVEATALLTLNPKDLLSAERACKRAIEIHPSEQATWLRLGRLLVDQGKREEANALVFRLLRRDDLSNSTLSGLGALYLDLGEYEVSKDLFNRCLEAEPTVAENNWNLGTALFILGDFASAESSLNTAVELGYLQARGPLVAAIVANGKFDEAAVLFASLPNGSSDQTTAMSWMRMKDFLPLAQRLKPAEVTRLADYVAHKVPASGPWKITEAKLRMHAGESAAAIEIFEKMISGDAPIQPGSDEKVAALGLLSIQVNAVERSAAFELFQALLARSNRPIMMRHVGPLFVSNYGMWLQRGKKYETLIDLMTVAIELFPTSLYRLSLVLGAAHFKLGNSAEAEMALRAALDFAATDNERLSVTIFLLKVNKRAMHDFKRVLLLPGYDREEGFQLMGGIVLAVATEFMNPSDLPVALAVAQREAGAQGSARLSWRLAEASALGATGTIGGLHAAERILREMIATGFATGVIYRLLGVFLAKLDRPEESIEAYRLSLESLEPCDMPSFLRTIGAEVTTKLLAKTLSANAWLAARALVESEGGSVRPSMAREVRF